jgi:hypothetical protein
MNQQDKIWLINLLNFKAKWCKDKDIVEIYKEEIIKIKKMYIKDLLN